MSTRGRSWAAVAAAALLVVIVSIGPGAASAGKPEPSKPTAGKVIMFAADGMRPDLVEQYAEARR